MKAYIKKNGLKPFGSNPFFYIFSICQSIGSLLTEIKKLLILENGLLPKNPLDADSGLGWTEVRIKCLLLVINSFFFIALFPHNKNTTGSSFSLTKEMILSVNTCHPIFLCELASPALTVRDVLSNNTPWSAHFFK